MDKECLLGKVFSSISFPESLRLAIHDCPGCPKVLGLNKNWYKLAIVEINSGNLLKGLVGNKIEIYYEDY
jgi:hypothetical protein